MSTDLITPEVAEEFNQALIDEGFDPDDPANIRPRMGGAPEAIPAWILTLAWPIVAKVIATVAIPYFKEKFPAAADALDAIAAWLLGGAKELPA